MTFNADPTSLSPSTSNGTKSLPEPACIRAQRKFLYRILFKSIAAFPDNRTLKVEAEIHFLSCLPDS